MNNSLKYILLSLTFSATPLLANACEIAGGSEEDCMEACSQPQIENYDACMLGTPAPTGQTDQSATQ
ncbi:Uncharacterised protein [Yersinia thracica]|uniref:Lipoprotein n=1 Tax=Yersinia thracica TaxID=2890319 RepID=A0A0T9NTC9_9GAMM|nr:Uncharacterised protein [Yersinia thracica]